MSEPTAPVCPQCGTPRAADGTPACACGRLASDAHRDDRTAQAEAAEDFDPVRIRPFVQVGDETGRAGTPEEPEDERHPTTAAAPDEEPGPDADPPVQGEPSADEHMAAGRAADGRRRRVMVAAGAGAVAAAVLVTGGIIGGLFSYEAPSREGSGPGDVRADIPEAAAGAEASAATVSPSATASSSPSPSRTASASPEATPTGTRATPTPSGPPGRTPSGGDGKVTPSPTPTRTTGRPPVLSLGDQGAEVTELQLRLAQTGVYTGDADGDYDREVQSAVRGYQLTRVLLADESGVYGEATRASLESETSEP
ncbi:peptidoglycan-binding domain-containing protein [Streptomyces griseiscabiei]|uniref:Peptidoglycan-binding domain-containing protein n=1 Tax=Streptomyces griseiscabiei TaxID=2993540 RepID=A0ABU4L7F1_9ACTN|nr:peptidoglycan-binding domain-containing protein [Streptomyces griseiscabiei]MBZ3901812.1 peptidoglycan-binding protein [Streptomyces griseiscabiei]MDX2910988.1 peptidoglycan-binding domain-containing protein [Streptomyces griseiscabiei]